MGSQPSLILLAENTICKGMPKPNKNFIQLWFLYEKGKKINCEGEVAAKIFGALIVAPSTH